MPLSYLVAEHNEDQVVVFDVDDDLLQQQPQQRV